MGSKTGRGSKWEAGDYRELVFLGALWVLGGLVFKPWQAVRGYYNERIYEVGESDARDELGFCRPVGAWNFFFLIPGVRRSGFTPG